MRNYLKDSESYGIRKRSGLPPKITTATRRRLFREVTKEQSISRNLQKSQNLLITTKKAHQLLHESPNLVHRNRETAAALTAKHDKMLVDWVKEKMSRTKEK